MSGSEKKITRKSHDKSTSPASGNSIAPKVLHAHVPRIGPANFLNTKGAGVTPAQGSVKPTEGFHIGFRLRILECATSTRRAAGLDRTRRSFPCPRLRSAA